MRLWLRVSENDPGFTHIGMLRTRASCLIQTFRSPRGWRKTHTTCPWQTLHPMSTHPTHSLTFHSTPQVGGAAGRRPGQRTVGRRDEHHSQTHPRVPGRSSHIHHTVWEGVIG